VKKILKRKSYTQSRMTMMWEMTWLSSRERKT
jgi:hypothetical protein